MNKSTIYYIKVNLDCTNAGIYEFVPYGRDKYINRISVYHPIFEAVIHFGMDDSHYLYLIPEEFNRLIKEMPRKKRRRKKNDKLETEYV